MTQRGENHVIYIKKASYISDMLGIMGADDAMLEFESIRVNKGVHGDIMRMVNCDSANVDRTLAAAQMQAEWIRKIAESELGHPLTDDDDPLARSREYSEGLRHLPKELRDVAMLRIERPEASLSEIGEALAPSIGKAAVNKRFAKIKTIAEGL